MVAATLTTSTFQPAVARTSSCYGCLDGSKRVDHFDTGVRIQIVMSGQLHLYPSAKHHDGCSFLQDASCYRYLMTEERESTQQED
jgi:hypothetical protein